MGLKKVFKKGKRFNTVKQPNTYVARISMAVNPETSPEMLSQLAEDPHEEVRTEVAVNFKTPPEVLNLLSKDKSMWVRVRLAGNTKLPLEAIIRLSNDKSAWVRANIATNPSTPVDILVKMLHNDSGTVADSVATNPKAPYEMLISDEVLHKIGAVGAVSVFKRGEFTRETATKIIYGDYPEHVVRAAVDVLVEDEAAKIHTLLKYGKKKHTVLDYDRFTV